MLSSLKYRDQQREEGFTLIELLVVVIIIGILAAIAIPVFLAQRERAWRSSAQSDLRNGAVSLETYYTDEGYYWGDPSTPDGAFASGFGFNPTAGVTHHVTYADSDGANTTSEADEPQAYCMGASHDNHDENWYLGTAGTLSDDSTVACPNVPTAPTPTQLGN